MKVRDAMTASVRTVRRDASLKEAAAVLAEHRIGGVPVVDGDGGVIGVISKADILLKECAEEPHHGLRGLLRRESSETATKVAARTVEEAMCTPAITVEPWYSLASAGELMLEHGVNRLPVVEHGELVGIITRYDLVRAFARGDSDLEREIRAEALRDLAWSDGLDLRVANGEVTVRGELESRFDAEALPGLIRHVPGVVSVDCELTAWDPEANRKVTLTTQL